MKIRTNQFLSICSVGGTDYGSVRIGAFMGRKIIKSTASQIASHSQIGLNGLNHVDMSSDDFEEDGIELFKAEASLDYLCNLSPHRHEAVYSKKLPDSILGEAFVKEYDNHDDTVTIIDQKRSYEVKAPTKHPIFENFRVMAFKALLTSIATNDQLIALGELMYQCHYSYNDCRLGSDGTDRLVKLVQEMQYCLSPSKNGNLFGAKITGGGSGGSICVIGKNTLKSSEQILKIQQRYKAATGHLPYIFDGSSPGAGVFGYLKLRRISKSKSGFGK